MENPAANPGTNPCQPKSKLKRWLIAIFILLIVLASIFFAMARYKANSLKAMKMFIDEEAAKYGTRKDEVAKLITDSAGEILSERQMVKLAKSNSKTLNISFERAVVDLAVGQLRSMKLIG